MDSTTFFLLALLVFILICNVIGLLWFGWMLPALISGGGPYVPSREEDVERMVVLAQLTSMDRVADLGSGDGRIVIAAVKAGAREGVGYEIHPGLVRLARRNARKAGVAGQTKMLWKSMWRADLHDVQCVILYQIPYAMRKIGDKLQKELPSGARVVSNAFIFPNWEPSETHGKIRIYRKE